MTQNNTTNVNVNQRGCFGGCGTFIFYFFLLAVVVAGISAVAHAIGVVGIVLLVLAIIGVVVLYFVGKSKAKEREHGEE
jgi:threonine/homoserine/homoserine lactone efflux protein